MFLAILALVSDSAPLLAMGIERLWYAAPLIVSVSLVYSATRHEETGPILQHAARFALWVLVFMAIVTIALSTMGWLASG